MGYESLSDIDKAFKRRLAEAADAEVPAIERELADAKVEFLSGQLQARELQDARRAALDKFPHAKEWEDMITGATAAEIEASAQKIHERMEKFQPQGEPQQQAPQTPQAPRTPDPATQAYGQPGVGGAGAPSPGPDREKELEGKLIGVGGGQGRNITRNESSELFRMRAKRALAIALQEKGTPVGLGRGVNPRQALK